MADASRVKTVSRRSWLLAGLAAPLFSARAAQALQIQYDGDSLRVSVPTLHILTGGPLKLLQDGSSVVYVAQLDLLSENRAQVVKQDKARFALSYALWEEKFSVTRLGNTPRTAEGLSAAAAEAWCFENLALSTLGIAPDLFYWLRFDIRTATARDFSGDAMSGLSIPKLIEILGRKNTPVTHWDPLEMRVRLADLPRIHGRGGPRA